MHITIDGFGASREKLASEDFVRETLDTIPAEMGMTKISIPNVFRFEHGKPEDWGVSGFVLITESHIAIHTFPHHGQIWVDVFSTKYYDSDKFAESIATRFESEEVRTHRFERGIQYPHNGEGKVPGPKELGEERNNWSIRTTGQQNQKER